MTIKVLRIKVNEAGRRVGETHHRSKLSDADVDLMRDLHEDHGLWYDRLSKRFGVAKSTVRDIVTYRHRISFVADVRVIRIEEKEEEEV